MGEILDQSSNWLPWMVWPYIFFAYHFFCSGYKYVFWVMNQKVNWQFRYQVVGLPFKDMVT